MSLVHRQEVLDAHMNHSNWKKLVRIGEVLLSPMAYGVNGDNLIGIQQFHHF
jgi:hypothetical protein